jgi:uncharacterized protein
MREYRMTRGWAARRAAAWLLALVAMAMAAGPVAAQSLDELRAQGVVGERFDGYAVVRAPGASAQVQSFVANVNAQRRAIYQQRATQQHVPADQVGRVYAKQLFERAPPGTWFLDETGKWVRK